MAAIVYRGGRVLSQATNGARTGRHAELRAIARDRDLSGASIVVARPGGERYSRPCRVCFLTIRDAGIKRMGFLDEVGKLVIKRVNREDEFDYRDYALERR